MQEFHLLPKATELVGHYTGFPHCLQESFTNGCFSVWALLNPVQLKHLCHAAVQASPVAAALYTTHYPISATEIWIMQPEMPFVAHIWCSLRLDSLQRIAVQVRVPCHITCLHAQETTPQASKQI